MIVRQWRGRTTPANAEAYVRHVTETVFPSLGRLAGHRGAYLLKRTVDGHVEFVAVTLWASLEAIQAFASPEIDRAVIEPQAQAVLTDADRFAAHYVVAYGDCRQA
jgi:heme-degrading monooxygenase HmoA